MKRCFIYILSDSLGDTGEHVANAAAGQFVDIEFIIKKYPYIADNDEVDAILDEAASRTSIVVFTTVIESLKDYISNGCKKRDIMNIDIINPLIFSFQKLLGVKPVYEPGTIHKLDETYFARVKAVEFAVKYDDGKDPRGVKLADIVLLGISRTSKTPLSMYLAHKNVKVANIPLVPEVALPSEVYQIDPSKIVGLINTPEKLFAIREERLKAMGLAAGSSYANLERINQELEYADKIFKELGCPVIDVSDKAVEETANMILRIHAERRAALERQ